MFLVWEHGGEILARKSFAEHHRSAEVYRCGSFVFAELEVLALNAFWNLDSMDFWPQKILFWLGCDRVGFQFLRDKNALKK